MQFFLISSANIQKNPHKAKFFFNRSMSELLAVGYWLLAKKLKKVWWTTKKATLMVTSCTASILLTGRERDLLDV